MKAGKAVEIKKQPHVKAALEKEREQVASRKKKFSKMSPAEKDELLRSIAVKLGMVADE